MSIRFKKSPIEYNQRLLLPGNVFDLLPDNHECYLYKDIFQQIDTSSLEDMYSPKGQNAYHPRLIVSVLYTHTVRVFLVQGR